MGSYDSCLCHRVLNTFSIQQIFVTFKIFRAKRLTVFLGTVTLNPIGTDALVVSAKRYIQHPDYNPNAKYNDIALIKLNSSVPYTGKL